MTSAPQSPNAPILITGIGGGLAQRVALRLVESGRSVVGVDYRPVATLPAALQQVPIHRASYVKTAIEDVFRATRPAAVLHLGREGNLAKRVSMRFDMNVVGSQKIFDLARAFGVETLVVLSTFHIYGAHPHNHCPISEDDPVRAGVEFPEIADAIQLDSMAQTWVWRHQAMRTVVLRPTNVVGPTLQNTMSTFLRRPRVLALAGFNPMMQFVHEDDLARAVVAALEGSARGTFNVAGADCLPWRSALSLAGARPITVPTTLARLAVKTFTHLPAYLINFYKYPCIITDAAFRREFAWSPRVDIRETLASTVQEARIRRQGVRVGGTGLG